MKLKSSGPWVDWKSSRMKEVMRNRREGCEPGAKILEEKRVMFRKLVDGKKKWYNGWDYWDKEGKQCME